MSTLAWWCLLSIAGASPLTNPDFAEGLEGWLSTEAGGRSSPGTVTPDPLGVRLTEGDSLLVRLSQSFILPLRPEALRFSIHRTPGFDATAPALPDAFEARLVDADGRSIVATWAPTSTAWFNLQEDDTAHLAEGSSFDGLEARLDLSRLAPDQVVRVEFDLLGTDADTLSSVVLGPVHVDLDNEPPVAVVGPAIATCGAPLFLDASESSDPDGDALTFRWLDGEEVLATGVQASVPLAPGIYPLTLEVTDALSATTTLSFTATVVAPPPPELSAPETHPLQPDADCEAVLPDLVPLAEATDECSEVTVTQDPPPGEVLAAGSSRTVTLTATNAANLTAEVEVLVTVDAGACEGDTDEDTGGTTPIDTDDSDTDDSDDSDTDQGPPPDTGDTGLDSGLDTSLDSAEPVDTGPTQPIPVDPDTDSDDSDTDTSAVPDDPPGEGVIRDDEEEDTPGRTGCSCDTGGPNGGLPLLLLLITPLVLRRRSVAPRPRAWLAGMATLLLLLPNSALADTPIGLNQPVSGTLAQPLDEHRYTFEAAPGQWIYGQNTSATANNRLSWRIEDAYGRVITQGNTFVVLPRVRLMGGTYTVVLTDRDFGAVDYTFAVFDADPIDGGALSLDTPTTASLPWPGSEIVYTLEVQDTTRIGLNATALSNDHWRQLEDAWGNLLAGGTARFDDLNPLPLRPGTYTLRIGSRSGGTGDVTFSLHGLDTEVVPLPLDTSIPGEISEPYARQIHPFQIDEEGVYDLSFPTTSNVNAMGYHLRRAGGATLVTSNTRLANQERIHLRPGTHELEVFGRGSNTGTYTVRLVQATDTEHEIALDEEISLTFDTPGDRHLLRLPNDEGARVALHRLSGSTVNFNWALRDPTGHAVITPRRAAGWESGYTLGPGVHTVEVTTRNFSTGPISVRVQTLDDPVVEEATVGGVVSGAITVPGQVWEHPFSVGAPLTLSVLSQGTTSFTNARMRLTDASGRLIASRNNLGNIEDIDLMGGDYVLTIEPTGAGTSSWSFLLDPVGTPSYTPPTGAPLTLDQQVDATLAAAGTPDVYTLVLAQDTPIYAQVISGNFNLFWTLRDEVGRAVFANQRANNSASSLGPYTLRAGTYTLELVHASATVDYAFNLRTVTPDETFTTAVGAEISGTLPGTGVRHHHTLTLTEPTEVAFNLLSGSAALTWELTDPQGNTRFQSNAQFTSSQNISRRTLGPGTWTLTWTATRGDPVTYAAEVVQVTDQSFDLTFDTDTFHSLASRDGHNTYTFEAQDGDVALFDLLSGASRLSWTLTSPAGQQVWDSSAQFSSSQNVGPLPLHAGTWTLRFSADQLREASYGFAVRRISPTSQSIAFDTPIEGETSIAQPARFTFEVDQARDLFFDNLFPAGSAYLTLEDEAGHPYIDDQRLNSPTASDVGPLTLGPGTYTATVRGTADGQPYAVQIFDVTHPQPPPTLRYYRIRQDNLSIPGQDRLYTFEVPVSGLVITADLTDGFSGLRWEILDPVGTPAAPLRNAHSWADNHPPVPLAAGTYTIRFTAIDDRLGPYRFKVVPSLPDDPAFCDATGRPDLDCDQDGVVDVCAVLQGSVSDCNQNLVPDTCDVAEGEDCNNDGIPDDCFNCPLVELVVMMDTSGSMTGERDALCERVPAAIQELSDRGIILEATLMGIGIDNPSFTCLDRSAGTRYGTDVPLDPPPELATFAECSSAFPAGAEEDWGRGVAVVAANHPWRVGTVRAIVVIADEGPYCGDPQIDLDDLSVAHAITVARAFDVQTHFIAGNGTPEYAAVLGRQLAEATGGQFQTTTSDPGRYLDLLSVIGEDACLDFFDCNRNDIPDVCELAAGDEVDCACGRIPEVCRCDGPPTLHVSTPVDGARFAPGDEIILAGTAVPSEPERDVAAVLIDGRAVPGLDAAGRFFAPYTVRAGEQTIHIEAIDRCGPADLWLTLHGDPAFTTTQLQDVTGLVEARFRDTAFHGAREELWAEGAPRNRSDTPLGGPLLLTAGPALSPFATVLGEDGTTDEGQPYFQMLPAGATLAPGATGAWRPVAFGFNPLDALRFSPRWYQASVAPPRFLSVPPVWIRAERPWSFWVEAVDPAGWPLTYALVVGPPGATLDPVTGLLQWTPSPSQVGHHDLVVQARNDVGGTVQQAFTLAVRPLEDNAPPYFLDAPPTWAPGGADWSFTLRATDPDGDPLTFSLTGAPDGMTYDDGAQTLRWQTPVEAVVSPSLTVSDGRGGSATLRFQLKVGGEAVDGNAPAFVSQPPTEVVVGDLYVYQPAATDPDGDVLTFSLTGGPPQLTFEPSNGRVVWAPARGDVGELPLSLEVSDGTHAVTQSWTIRVLPNAADRPPVFRTQPTATQALVGQAWTYAAVADDPEGLPVIFTLVEAPSGMEVHPTDGRVTWTPSAPGTFAVRLAADAPMGVRSEQAFTIEVRGDNQPPVWLGQTLDPAWVGERKSWLVQAVDPDGDPLTYTLLDGPPGLSLTPWTGLVTWRPQQAGDVTFQARVDDPWGGSDTTTFTIDVREDTAPPEVALWLGGEPGCLGTPLQACVRASDNVGVASTSLLLGDTPIDLDGAGCTFLDPAEPGWLSLALGAVDTSGNGVSTEREVLFVDCDDPDKPTVVLHAPTLGEPLFGPTELVLTIDDNTPAFLTWSVDLRPLGAGEADWRTLASGTGAIEEGPVALIDPTLLPHDDYEIRVLASDGASQEGFIARWGVGGPLKIGQSRVAFTDTTLAARGIPLAITRSYDSFDERSDDFGPGWKVGFSGRVWDTAKDAPEGAVFAVFQAEPFLNDTRVYVIKPDGERVGFTFDPQPRSFPSMLQYTPTFRPDPGVKDTLVAVDAPTTVWNYGTGYVDYILPYNPSRYALTTPEGLTYTYDEALGLISVTDPYGATLTVTPDGVEHSDGPAIRFERDSASRITRLVVPGDDPSTDRVAHTYTYDEQGRLTASTDPLGASITYAYEDPGQTHLLTGVTDPTGRPVLVNRYDADGRLVAQCPAGADPSTLDGCARIEVDVAGGLLTTFDARGLRIDTAFNAQGHLTLERRFLPQGGTHDTTWTRDERGRPLTETIDGATFSFIWDSRDRLTSATDPEGRTQTFAYAGDCFTPVALTDEAGATERRTLDAACREVHATGRLGEEAHATYDERGLRTSVTDPSGATWSFTYDERGQRTAILDPAGRAIQETHDERGRLVRVEDREGRVITMTWDEADRLTELTQHTLPPTSWTYTYDAAGRLLTATTPEVTLTRTHDPVGRLHTETLADPQGSFSHTATWTWDLSGRVATFTDEQGVTTTHTWDALRRLAGLEVSGGPLAAPYAVTQTWDGLDRLTGRTMSVDGAPVIHSTLTYDSLGSRHRLSGIAHRRADHTLLHELTFDRDARGWISAMTDAEGSHLVEHDSTGRLRAITRPEGGPQPDERYTYNTANQRLTSHHSDAYVLSDPATAGHHLLLADDTHDHAYNLEGQLLTRTDRSTGERLELTWDHRGRVRTLTRRDAADTVLEVVHLHHDATGRLVATTRNGERVWRVHDRDNPVLELADDASVLRRRLYVDGLDQPVAEADGGGLRWLLADHQGTVRDRVDSTGTPTEHHVYEAFGASVAQPPTTVGYAGMRTLGIAGLYDARARLYDPSVGRFLSPDPRLPFRAEYAQNSPLHHTDPTGESVAVTYACLAFDAAMNTMSFAENIGLKVHAILRAAAEGLEGVEADGQGLANDLGQGIGSMLNGQLGPAGLPNSTNPPKDAAEIILKAGCGGRSQP